MTPHDRATCEFCQAVATMDKIMAMIDDIPEWDIPLFDDAIQAVYEAAQDAEPILRCRAAYDEDHAPDDYELGNVGYPSVANIINAMEYP